MQINRPIKTTWSTTTTSIVRNTSTHSCLMDSSVAKPKKSNDAISIKSPKPCIDTTEPLRPSTTKKSVDISFAIIAVLPLL